MASSRAMSSTDQTSACWDLGGAWHLIGYAKSKENLETEVEGGHWFVVLSGKDNDGNKPA